MFKVKCPIMSYNVRHKHDVSKFTWEKSAGNGKGKVRRIEGEVRWEALKF
jgi:hypothetical protein